MATTNARELTLSRCLPSPLLPRGVQSTRLHRFVLSRTGAEAPTHTPSPPLLAMFFILTVCAARSEPNVRPCFPRQVLLPREEVELPLQQNGCACRGKSAWDARYRNCVSSRLLSCHCFQASILTFFPTAAPVQLHSRRTKRSALEAVTPVASRRKRCSVMALAESLVVWVPFRCSSGGRSRPTALARGSSRAVACT